MNKFFLNPEGRDTNTKTNNILKISNILKESSIDNLIYNYAESRLETYGYDYHSVIYNNNATSDNLNSTILDLRDFNNLRKDFDYEDENHINIKNYVNKSYSDFITTNNYSDEFSLDKDTTNKDYLFTKSTPINKYEDIYMSLVNMVDVSKHKYESFNVFNSYVGIVLNGLWHSDVIAYGLDYLSDGKKMLNTIITGNQINNTDGKIVARESRRRQIYTIKLNLKLNAEEDIESLAESVGQNVFVISRGIPFKLEELSHNIINYANENYLSIIFSAPLNSKEPKSLFKFTECVQELIITDDLTERLNHGVTPVQICYITPTNQSSTKLNYFNFTEFETGMPA